MINKGFLYSTVKNITPPFLFKIFKNSSLYGWLVRNSKYYTSTYNAQEIMITGGDLKGHILKLDPNGPWQQEMILGEYDKELFARIKALNLNNKVVYDIGSHIGYHSMAFATYVNNNGHVFAFEPNPTNVERAEEIMDLNPDLKNRVTVLNLALSNEVGSTKFLSTDDIEGGTSTGGFIDEANTLWERDRYINDIGFKVREVKIDTIDNLVSSNVVLPPDMLKIDVEGAEQSVLEGAQNTIIKYRPLIIVEFHSIYSAYRCIMILSDLKYSLELLKKEPDGRVMILAK